MRWSIQQQYAVAVSYLSQQQFISFSFWIIDWRPEDWGERPSKRQSERIREKEKGSKREREKEKVEREERINLKWIEMAIFVWFLPVSAARGNGTEDIKIHKSTIFAAEYLTQYASNWRRSPADLTKIWKNKYLTQYSRNWSRLNQTWRKFERICQLPVSNERNLFIIWHNNPVTGYN